MTTVEINDTTLEIDDRGVNVTWENHEFRLRKQVIEAATNKDYTDVTDHEILGMIDRDKKPSNPPKTISQLL